MTDFNVETGKNDDPLKTAELLAITDNWADFLLPRGIAPTTEEAKGRLAGQQFIDFIRFLSPSENNGFPEFIEYASELPQGRIEQFWNLFSLVYYEKASENSYSEVLKTNAFLIGEILKEIDNPDKNLLPDDENLLRQMAADLCWCLFYIKQDKDGIVGLQNFAANEMIRAVGKGESWSAFTLRTNKTVVYVEKEDRPEDIGRACFTIMPIDPEGIMGRRETASLTKSADRASIDKPIETTTFKIEYDRFPDNRESRRTVHIDVKERMRPNGPIEKFSLISFQN